MTPHEPTEAEVNAAKRALGDALSTQVNMTTTPVGIIPSLIIKEAVRDALRAAERQRIADAYKANGWGRE